MKSKSKVKDYNSNFINQTIADEKFFNQEEKKKKIEREKRIKELNKAKKKEEDTFDFDTETVIGMTNKNNIARANQKKQVMSKKQREMQKKKKKIKLIFKIFTFTFLLAGTLIFTMISPIFNIKNIEVENNNLVSKDTIVSLSGLNSNQNIFKFFKKNVEKALKENTYIESAEISRKLPSTVKISVTERERKYSLEFLNGYAYINNQGYILEISDEKLDLPTIIGSSTPEENIIPGNRLEIKDLKKLEVVINIMRVAENNDFADKITSIDISNENEYSLFLEDEQKTVHLGDGSNLKDKLIWIPEILEKEDGIEGDIYVDGDFNNKFRAYFREKV